ncbi:hypothetical protein BU26DRAFT_611160 [Trematosphaeria pertusa]|uniref:Peptidase S54 rhomboid domain-containing protein n=1 Tax=Trematosphaeria pertusa TaxID=390896 RepID=A0A6A6HSS3_9PLEO|nr:uncharacterized protein BU26DRAFT_611160 [Trematosphaeria pertusa]KAF2240949.1 hypothetical protein BU26DRAFT_611160 [Trematosphaeria pertusa]
MTLLRNPSVWVRPLSSGVRCAGSSTLRLSTRPFRAQSQTRGKHTKNPPNAPSSRPQSRPFPQGQRAPVRQEKQDVAEEKIPGQFPKVKVRYLRPAVYAISVSSGIFIFLAYMEAREELKPKAIENAFPQWQIQRRAPPTPTEVATRAWDELTPISKLSWGIIAANGAVHLTSFVAPRYWHMLWHTPAANANFQLFTSTWVHSGPMHLLFNMWACHNFLPSTGYSRLFEGDPYHTLSFYLSAGLISGYAQHLTTMFARARAGIPAIFIPSGGASGALFGVFAAFCMQYPDAGVGILFVPYYMDAQYFLPAIMLFDFVGMVRGYSFVNFGHAAHLAGASMGIVYSYFDGKNRIWKPLVRFWKRRLQNQS